MRWFTKHLRNVGIVSVGILFLLTCLALIPLSAASAHVGMLGVATPTTVTVQVTPTEDATVTALNKEQLTLEVAEQQHTWDNWLWSNAATISSTLVIVIGALFGLWRWRRDQHTDLEKRAEERFQSAVTGLGDDKEGARIGAAILLRTFLRPGYEQFYAQAFDLAVANLRLPRASHPPQDPDTPFPLTILSQALIVVFKEAFPLARRWEKKSLQSLDATGIQLDNAYLSGVDLGQGWMPQSSLRNVNLSKTYLGMANLSGADLRGANLSNVTLWGANLSGANLSGADLTSANLSGANLSEADLTSANLSKTYLRDANFSGANLRDANLSEAYLRDANLSRANFSGANLNLALFGSAESSRSGGIAGHSAFTYSYLISGADLDGTNIEDAQFLKDADLRGVKGLTKKQRAACKAKGAIIDEEPTTNSSQSTAAPSSSSQSNDTQALSAPPAQESTPPADPDGTNTASSQLAPDSGN
jgi:uncharacterized protein YjbI with pentapeptide repeats